MTVRVRCPDGTGPVKRTLRAVQIFFVLAGAGCIAAFSWLQFEQRYYGERYLQEFERAAESVREPRPLPPLARLPPRTSAVSTAPEPSEPPDSRRDGLSLAGARVLARLRIDGVGLDAPVLEGVEERVLRRGAGWIPGTARPGETGNVGIAAHRDTFFRPLREIRSGDRVELETLARTQSYVVRSVYVVEPEYPLALRPTGEPTLTLVTCFPFDYLGPAPRRFIVQAVADGAGPGWE